MNLQGAKVLVTGGAVRIGRAICLALAEAGADVVIHYRSSEKEAGRLCQEIISKGVSAYICRADLSDLDTCGKLIAEADDRAGGLDVLVNNAAVFHKDSLETLDAEKLNTEMTVNLFAPMLLTRAFAKRMKKGKVVNLLDRRVAGYDTSCVPYVLSKKGLMDFTRLAALELTPDITVNGVAPGAVLPPPGENESYVSDLAGAIPLEKCPKPEDVADAVLFCLKNDAVTGEVLYVDGGQHLLKDEI